MTACGHRLCELTGRTTCEISTHRSRGCRPNLTSRTVAPEVLDEVRALLAMIDAADGDISAAAIRLATIVRREALDDRSLLAYARSDEPELAPALERLCVRRSSSSS